MASLTCNCGFTAKDDDRYKVEATMWHHAIHDHDDILKSMTVEQIEQWLKSKDTQLSAE